MNNIIFKNVAFDKELYTGAVVSGNFITIYAGHEYVVKFQSPEEAINGLHELHNALTNTSTNTSTERDSLKELIKERTDSITNDMSALLNGIKDGSALKALKDIQNKLESKVDDFKHTAQDKAMEAVFNKVFSSESNTLDEMFNSLDKAMGILFPEDTGESNKEQETVVPEKKEESKRQTVRKFNVDDILTTVQKSQKAPKVLTVEEVIKSNKLIEDMTTSELRMYIDVFVTDIISTEKGVNMINTIKANFCNDAVDASIEKFKELVYVVCTENAEMTFMKVMTSYFL